MLHRETIQPIQAIQCNRFLVSSYYFFAIYNPDKIRNKEILAVIEGVFNSKKRKFVPSFPQRMAKIITGTRSSHYVFTH